LTTVAPPLAAQTPAGLLQVARDMVPRLRERQAECERLGRLPDATQREFVDAGLYRVLQPRRFGGFEFDLGVFFSIMAEIARGCPSSGWVLALTAGHAHTLAAVFPEETQIETFGADAEYRAPLSGNGRGVLTTVDDGYRVSGGWSYVSGCETATHFIGMAQVAESETRCFVLLDRSAFQIVEDWDVMGMQGTGSHRVVVEDVFVPARQVIGQPMDEMGSRNAPGRGVHANPLYAAGRIGSVLFGEMAAVAVGMALGALDVYEVELRTKKMNYPPFAPRAEVAEYQRHFGEAWALISMASATLERIGLDYMSFAREDAEGGEPFSDRRDCELRLLEQYVTKLAADAIDVMFRSAGTSAARRASPLQRYFRDAAIVRTHFAAQHERGAEEFGRTYFGGASKGPWAQ
jgi:3-hydroxy-9,10-secoandrosta-1,3,5(10)-triene-9,17-dione monooxygenase